MQKTVVLVVTAGTCLAATAWLRKVVVDRKRWDRKRRVIVLCAVKEEALHVEFALEGPRKNSVLQIGSHTYRRVRGSIGRFAIDVVCCGVGTVDAASMTTALLLEELPSLVVNCGCSGGHTRSVRVGDVVVATAIIPTSYKMVRPDGASEHVGLRIDTKTPPRPQLEAEHNLVQMAKTAGTIAMIPAWITTPRRKPAVHLGPVGSSDVWNQDPRDINRHHETLGTLCEEMESFAVARVCSKFNVPWLVVKDVVNNELIMEEEENFLSTTKEEDFSDREQDKETGLGESLFLDEIGRRAAAVVIQFLKDLHL